VSYDEKFEIKRKKLKTKWFLKFLLFSTNCYLDESVDCDQATVAICKAIPIVGVNGTGQVVQLKF